MVDGLSRECFEGTVIDAAARSVGEGMDGRAGALRECTGCPAMVMGLSHDEDGEVTGEVDSFERRAMHNILLCDVLDLR